MPPATRTMSTGGPPPVAATPAPAKPQGFDQTAHPTMALKAKVAALSEEAREALLYLLPSRGLPSFTPKRIRDELAAAGLDATATTRGRGHKAALARTLAQRHQRRP